MDKSTKVIVGIVVLALVVWGVVAAVKKHSVSNTNQAVAGDTYKIGVLLPLTGDAASYGEPGQQIYQLAVDEINNSGGVNGKKLELVIEDAKCNGKDAASAMQKLVSVDKVQAVLGGFCSSESLAAVPIAEQNKVALLSPGSSSPKLTGISKFFTRNYPSDAFQGQVLAQIAEDKGYKKVAIIQEQTDYAVGNNVAFSDKFKSLGGSVVTEEFASTVTDLRSQLTKLKGQNPDALLIDVQTPAAGERILKQLKDLGWKPQLFVVDIIPSDAQMVANNKDALEGAIGAEFGVDPANPKFQHLMEMYKNKFNADVPFQSYGQTEYDSVFLMRDAIAAVGYDGTKIATWLHGVSNWQGAAGSVTIGSNGEVATGHKPEIIKNGKVEPYVK